MGHKHQAFLHDVLLKVCRRPTWQRVVLDKCLEFPMDDAQRCYVTSNWKHGLLHLHAAGRLKLHLLDVGKKAYSAKESVPRPKIPPVRVDKCSWCGRPITSEALIVRNLSDVESFIHSTCYNPKEHHL